MQQITEVSNPVTWLYMLDAETKVTKRFSNPRAQGYSVPNEARVLLKAHGFLNRLVTVGQGI